ncbi:MAG: MFS transporter [Actinomycetota bacterium]
MTTADPGPELSAPGGGSEPPTAPEPPTAAEKAAIQRRTLNILFAASIFGRAGMTISFTVAALVLADILDGDETWSGASTASITVGTAISASLLSSMMNRRGRRPGLAAGFLAAAVGGGFAVLGAQNLLLVSYLIGLVFIGVGQGASTLSRYAAADLAAPDQRGKAISWVVFASTVGAVGGPTLVGPAGRLATSIGLDELVGPFVFSMAFFAVGALVFYVGLRPDPLVVAGGLRSGDDGGRSGFRNGWSAITASPLAQLAVIGLIVSQAVMVMVMAMTPLHMRAHDHELGTIGFVISAHTAGMFAFAPIAGWASDRYGRLPTLGAGMIQLVVATAMTALAGEAPSILMFPGLFLLGLGWSFGMVASSALLTESVDSERQVDAQGSADLVMSFASGLGALASGFVFTMAGFHILSMIGIVASGLVLAFTWYRHQTSGRLAI